MSSKRVLVMLAATILPMVLGATGCQQFVSGLIFRNTLREWGWVFVMFGVVGFLASLMATLGWTEKAPPATQQYRSRPRPQAYPPSTSAFALSLAPLTPAASTKAAYEPPQPVAPLPEAIPHMSPSARPPASPLAPALPLPKVRRGGSPPSAGADISDMLPKVMQAGQVLLPLMLTSWNEKRAMVVAHADVVLDEAVAMMAMLLMLETAEKQGPEALVTFKPLVQIHLELFQRCRRDGIDRAFADAALRARFEQLTSRHS